MENALLIAHTIAIGASLLKDAEYAAAAQMQGATHQQTNA